MTIRWSNDATDTIPGYVDRRDGVGEVFAGGAEDSVHSQLDHAGVRPGDLHCASSPVGTLLASMSGAMSQL